MGMGAEPTEELDVTVSDEMVIGIIEAAIHRVPTLEDASVLTTWAGIRPMTTDEHPILGPVPSVEGLVLNCGWGGAGIIQAPIAGQLVGEYVSDGYTSAMDIGALGIERFGKKSA